MSRRDGWRTHAAPRTDYARHRPAMFTHTCMECGMALGPKELHTYGVCLMFKACHDGDVVRAEIAAIIKHGSMHI